jgi:hypothetical protein
VQYHGDSDYDPKSEYGVHRAFMFHVFVVVFRMLCAGKAEDNQLKVSKVFFVVVFYVGLKFIGVLCNRS